MYWNSSGQTSQRIGSHFWEYMVDKTIAHEHYSKQNNQNFLYDIALIKLKESVKYAGHSINNMAVLPVCLFDEDKMSGNLS